MVQNILHRWFTAPVFPGDDDKTHLAAMFHALLWGLGGYTLLVIPFYLKSVWLPVCALVSIGAAMHFLRRGQVSAVRTGMLLLWACALCILPWFAGGIQSLSFHAYSLVVVGSALFGQTRLVVVILGMYVLNGAALEFAGRHHLLPAARIAYPSVLIGLGHSSILLTMAVMVHWSYKYLQISLHRAQREITERQQAENALRESEERYRQIVELSPNGIYLHYEGRVIYVNQACVNLLGAATPEALYQQPVLKFVHPNSQAIAQQRMRQVTQDRQALPFIEEQFVRLDGAVMTVKIAANPIMYQGRPAVQAVFFDVTAQKQAEHALQESEERYRQLVEFSPNGIFIYQQDRIVYVNQAGIDLLGASTPADLCGQPALRFIHPDSQAIARKRMRQAMQERQMLPFIEEQLVRLDDAVITVNLAANPIMYQGLPAVQVVVFDITAQKQAERALREREHWFRSIVENTEAGYFFIDVAGIIRDINPAWVRLYKYASAEEIVGQHFTVIQKLDDVEAAQECVAGIIRNDPRYLTGEFSRKCKDGRIGYHSFSARPVMRQAEVVGIEGFIIDTTNRRLAEDALRTSEKQSKAIIMAAPWGMHFYRLEADGQLIFIGANPAADTILGVQHREFVGKTIEEAFPGLTHTEIPDRYRAIARGGTTWHIEQSRYEHGSIHGVFEVTAFQTLPDHMAASFLDITTRKRAEEEIRTLNAELETRVQHRTAELEIANRELKDFAYSVSHDLKAPLRAISRITTWLVEDYAAAFDDRGQELVKMLIGRVQRMDELIEGILEYSRIGRVHGERISIDLTRLVYKIIDTLIPPAHIQIAINEPLPTITADKIRMTQVFQNLISNAIKFMDKPHGEIRIACVDADDFWKFSVTDNGPGIDLKYHDKIFQIFQTLHPRDEVESTGIGLAIVKKIVELYGGKIGVESKIEKGSTFWWTFPK